MPNSGAFRVELASDDAGVVLCLFGDFDLAAIEAMRTTTETIVGLAPGVVTIDATGVSFIDSSGLNALLGLRKRCTDIGVEVTLVNATRQVLALLEMTGLSPYFGVAAPADRDGDADRG